MAVWSPTGGKVGERCLADIDVALRAGIEKVGVAVITDDPDVDPASILVAVDQVARPRPRSWIVDVCRGGVDGLDSRVVLCLVDQVPGLLWLKEEDLRRRSVRPSAAGKLENGAASRRCQSVDGLRGRLADGGRLERGTEGSIEEVPPAVVTDDGGIFDGDVVEGTGRSVLQQR